MKLWQYLGGYLRSTKVRPPRRKARPALEQLESRLTPSALLYVDFGNNFPGGALTVNDSQMQDPKVNGPSSPPGGAPSSATATRSSR